MPTLVQICIVIVTLAFVAIVATTILALIRLSEAATRLTASTQESLAQIERIVNETQELMAGLREVLPPAERVVKRFQRLGERAADLSTAVLDEIEQPVLNAVAVARGVKLGTGHLLELLIRRFAQPKTSNNGEHVHE